MGLKHIVTKEKAGDKFLGTRKKLQRILEINLEVLHKGNLESSRLRETQKKAQKHLKNLSTYNPFKSVCTYTYLPKGFREIIAFTEKENRYYSPEFFKKLIKTEIDYLHQEIQDQLNTEINKAK